MLQYIVYFSILDGRTHSFSRQECWLLRAHTWVPNKALHPLPGAPWVLWLVDAWVTKAQLSYFIWNHLEGSCQFQSFLSELLRFLLLLHHCWTLLSTESFFIILYCYSITVVPLSPFALLHPAQPPTSTVNPHMVVHVCELFIHVLWLDPSPFSSP